MFLEYWGSFPVHWRLLSNLYQVMEKFPFTPGHFLTFSWIFLNNLMKNVQIQPKMRFYDWVKQSLSFNKNYTSTKNDSVNKFVLTLAVRKWSKFVCFELWLNFRVDGCPLNLSTSVLIYSNFYGRSSQVELPEFVCF